jgi:hypothetical protein
MSLGGEVGGTAGNTGCEVPQPTFHSAHCSVPPKGWRASSIPCSAPQSHGSRSCTPRCAAAAIGTSGLATLAGPGPGRRLPDAAPIPFRSRPAQLEHATPARTNTCIQRESRIETAARERGAVSCPARPPLYIPSSHVSAFWLSARGAETPPALVARSR